VVTNLTMLMLVNFFSFLTFITKIALHVVTHY
jgi:hypothetical protein